MDTKIQLEIKRLKYNLELYHASYMQELEHLEEKTQRLDFQIENCTSDVKREIIKRQKDYYQEQIEELDKNMEHNTNVFNTKITQLEEKLTSLREEKRSIDYNIKQLGNALERRNVNEIFDMFEHVKNAITILHEEIKSTSS
jgi:BMFP domain-containing protein YqiC